jgi:hypothetical protein
MPLNPFDLPDLATIKRRARALAMIEAIVCPEWANRYYSYNSKWGQDLEMSSMRNGSGDDWFLLFGPFGAGIKGLAHESPIAGDSALLLAARTSIPENFRSFLTEPAFNWDWMSFCYWLGKNDNSWTRAVHPDPEKAEVDDGSDEFLALLHQPARAYVEFTEWYYELSIPEASVEEIYRCTPLTNSLVQSINPELSLSSVASDALEIGYPLSSAAFEETSKPN